MKLLLTAFLIVFLCDIQAHAQAQPQISKPQSDTTAQRPPDSVRVTLSAGEYDALMKNLTGAANGITGAKKQSEYLTIPVLIWQAVELINERRTLVFTPVPKAPLKGAPPTAQKVPK